MIKNKDEYLTTADVAKKIGVTADHVRRLIAQGKIKAQKLGNNWIVNKRELIFQRQRYPREKREEEYDGISK